MAKTCLALIVWLCLAFPAVAAQGKTDTKKPVRPVWSELTHAQQQVLAPLAREWDSMDAARRKSWVTIADRYPKMKAQEQQRLQKRLADWAKLTPAQRKAAREKYQMLQKLPPDKRREVSAQWERYQRSLAANPDISPSDPPAPPETQSEEAPAVAEPAGRATAAEAPASPVQ